MMLGEKLMRLRKKQELSQQQVADILQITRQTVSNWECDQAYPAIDKAAQLAQLYHVSLDDLMEQTMDVITMNHTKDLHILQSLIGKQCEIECYDESLLLDNTSKITILEVNDQWIKIEYVRNELFKKEKVTRLLELDALKGIKIIEVLS